MAHKQKIKKKVFWPAFICFMAAGAAHASSITNLSGHAVSVGLEDAAQSSGLKKVDIANGETFGLPQGDNYVVFEGRRDHLEDALEYVIWKDTGIVPQTTDREKMRY